MSHLYLVLGIIGWALAPIVILAYLFWPRMPQDLPVDSKQKSIP